MSYVSRGTGGRRIMVVGLVADPGLPTELAEAMADRLPSLLPRQVDDTVEWRVEVMSGTLHLDESRLLTVPSDEQSVEDRGWDMMVGLTELPRRMGRRPLVLEVDRTAPRAWISVPALGGIRLRSRAEEAVVALVDRMAMRGRGVDDADIPAPAQHLSAVSDVSEPDGQVQAGSMRGWGSRVRLLVGMVRINRPWQLVGSLDNVFAAAAATSAFGIFYASVWNMADTLSPVRLALITMVAITAMVGWLIFHNGLWERSKTHGGYSSQPSLYNATTVLTLLVGVACMYALLFGAALLASLAVISSEYLEATLQHPVDFKDYTQIAWFASSMGIVAGALGSNFESEAAIRHVAYGRRQRERL